MSREEKRKRLVAMCEPLFPASCGKEWDLFFQCCDSLGALSHMSIYGPLIRNWVRGVVLVNTGHRETLLTFEEDFICTI